MLTPYKPSGAGIEEKHLQTVIRELQAKVFDSSEVTVLVNGSTKVNHKLTTNVGPRVPRGWLVVDKNAAVDVYRSAWDNSTITLESASPVTVTILIF
jgi:hypothetical protein